ncbi:MAG TPA: response regulator transcription factor [Anaerolineae bacterium]|jgi:DNA-binding response OmpR family regulator|nr:response regulator transcription factor [Anaerolineae bacterium]
MSRSFQLGDSIETRILIVDANHQNRSIRAKSLDLLGYKIDEATSGQQARAKLNLERYDLMLLNLDSASQDNAELMSMARELQPGLLFIVLTGNPTLDSAIKAVKAGASDYLLEPASIQDILRSVAQAWQKQAAEKGNVLNYISELLDELNRSESASDSTDDSQISSDATIITAGSLKLDLISRRLAIVGDPSYEVQLTSGGVAVLAGLMAHPNRVLSCRKIANISWGYDVPEDQARSIVRSTIYRLRRRIETNPGSPEIIRTVRGRGYMFTLD